MNILPHECWPFKIASSSLAQEWQRTAFPAHCSKRARCNALLFFDCKKDPSRVNITAAAAATLRICLAATWLTVASRISQSPSIGAFEIW